MSGQINFAVFKKIYREVERGGLVTPNDIYARVQIDRRNVADRMRLYAEHGLLYKVSKGRYAIDKKVADRFLEREKDVVVEVKVVRKQKCSVKELHNYFFNMVLQGVKDVRCVS
jgi:hypothetical protein